MISVIIPVREGGNPYITLASLATQTDRNFEVIVSWDHEPGNANRARNAGARLARGHYLLFSDDDIRWEPGAFTALRKTLDKRETAAFSYGSYRLGAQVHCDQRYSPELLRQKNYISTMSLIRREKFPGFDESIQRLMDWDLWLGLAERGEYGVYCGETIFSTDPRPGITRGNPITWRDAARIIWRKHNLPMMVSAAGALIT